MRRTISNRKKALYTRRIVMILSILVVALIQNTPHIMPSVFGSHALLLIPLVVCLGMFEKDLVAALLGAFAGALWDVTVAHGDGFNAFMLMIFASISSLLITHLMRNNLATASLLCGAAIVIYMVLHWFIFVICYGARGGVLTLFSFYLPSAIYTFIFLPVIYFLMRSFLRRIKE